MDLPKLKKFNGFIPERYPKFYDWKRDDDTSIFPVYSPIIAAVLPKTTPGAVVLALEEAELYGRRPAKIVLHSIETFTDIGEQLTRIVELRTALHDTDRIYIRMTELERDFFHFWNDSQGHYEKISYRRPPHTKEKGGVIDYHLGVFRELTRIGKGDLIFFPPNSEIPSVMAAIPEVSEKPLTDMEYPQQAAVVYALAGAYFNKTEPPGPPEPPKKKWDPWAILDELGSDQPGAWDPWKILEKDIDPSGTILKQRETLNRPAFARATSKEKEM